MRATALSAVIVLALALAMWPQPGRAQSDRDFVFTDDDGHLVIRFAGTGEAGLDSAQRYEVLNAEFSTMVHDHLHADLEFANEPRDRDWAASMEPEIEAHLRHAGLGLSNILTECSAASCRVIMEQPGHRSVPAHQAVLDTVQKSLEMFIADRRQQFESVFMLTAYDQAAETPHIKAFLRRTKLALPRLPAGR